MPPERVLDRAACLMIIEVRKAGATDAEISAQFFVCIKTVYNTMKRFRLLKQFQDARFYQTRTRLKTAIQLRRDGFSTENICKELGYKHIPNLYRALDQHGMAESFKKAKTNSEYRDPRYGRQLKKSAKLSLPWVYNRRAVFGESFRTIAKAAGCSNCKVEKFCKRYNIPKATPEQVAANLKNVNDSMW